MMSRLSDWSRLLGSASVVLVSTLVSSVWAQDFTRVAPAVAEKLSASGRKSVAVVDFTDLQANVTELGRFLAEEFQTSLVNEAKGFRVIDRTHLKAILQENRLATTGLIDPATARQLGKIAGVETLVTGTITPLGDAIRLSLKLIDATTAEIIVTAALDVPKTAAIAALISQPIQQPGVRASVGSPQSAVPPQAVGGNGVSGRSGHTANAGGFEFSLDNCRRQRTALVCQFAATYVQEKRRTLYVYMEASRYIDSQGDEGKGRSARLGAARSNSLGVLATDLTADVPVRGEIVFEAPPPGVSRLAIVELNCNFMVEFRDVVIN